MKTDPNTALGLTLAMGAVIFFCRLFPFLFFRDKPEAGGKGPSRRELFLNFVEKLAPPVVMTVLAFNAIAGPFRAGLGEGAPALIAAGVTALAHLWKRNPLFSISGGTLVYIILRHYLIA
jgi:branched-subunit amino acid transport protein AzlD